MRSSAMTEGLTAARALIERALASDTRFLPPRLRSPAGREGARKRDGWDLQLPEGFCQSYCGLYPRTRVAFSIEISDSLGWSGRLRLVPGKTSSSSLSLGWLITEFRF